VKSHEGLRVVLITPPLVDERLLVAADEERYDQRPTEPNRRTRISWRYSRAIAELGHELGTPVLDLAGAMLRLCRSAFHSNGQHLDDATGEAHSSDEEDDYWPGDREQPVSPLLHNWLRDGLHLTSAGYTLLYEELMKVIEREWPDQMPECLPFFYPAWDDETAWKPGGDGEGSRELLKQ